MKVKLDVSERIAGLRLLNEGGSSLSLTGLKNALELIGLLTLSEDEQKKIGFEEVVTEGEDGSQSRRLTWKDSSYVKDITVTEEQKGVLQDLIKQKDKQKKFSMSEGMAVVKLAEKLDK